MYKVLRLKIVIEKTGLAKSTVYKKISEGEFPKQFSLGGKAVGWLESDVNKWIGERVLIAANDNRFENENRTNCLKEPSSSIELISVSEILQSANDN